MGQIKPSPDFMSETNHKPMDVRVLKKSISDKMLLPKPKKKNDEKKNGKNNSNNKFLITINVLGSAGPVRFVVNENDTVSEVIDAALKLYARQDRLPVLGSDVNSFLLYPANAGLDGRDLVNPVFKILCSNSCFGPWSLFVLLLNFGILFLVS